MKSFTLGNLLTAAGNALTIPRPCVYVSSCTFDGTECTVALSENSRLYIDETEVWFCTVCVFSGRLIHIVINNL